MDTAVLAGHWVKIKENEKKRQILRSYQRTEKAMEHESDGDTSCNQVTWNNLQRLRGQEELEIRGQAKTIQTTDQPENQEESLRHEETCCH